MPVKHRTDRAERMLGGDEWVRERKERKGEQKQGQREKEGWIDSREASGVFVALKKSLSPLPIKGTKINLQKSEGGKKRGEEKKRKDLFTGRRQFLSSNYATFRSRPICHWSLSRSLCSFFSSFSLQGGVLGSLCPLSSGCLWLLLKGQQWRTRQKGAPTIMQPLKPSKRRDTIQETGRPPPNPFSLSPSFSQTISSCPLSLLHTPSAPSVLALPFPSVAYNWQ